MPVEILAVTFLAAEEKCYAIVSAGDHQRNRACVESHDPITAQSVAEENGIALSLSRAVNVFLKRRAQSLGRVVKSLLEISNNNVVRR